MDNNSKITGWTYWENEKYEEIPCSQENHCLIAAELARCGLMFTGTYHQCGDFGAPIIDGKYIYRCSQRTWGAIMAIAYPNSIKNKGCLAYIDWAWITPEGYESIVPSEGEGEVVLDLSSDFLDEFFDYENDESVVL